MLLAAPNFSEGREAVLVEGVSAQFAGGVRLLDSHSDPIHNRTVLTLSGSPEELREALLRGAGACFVSIDMNRHEGAHPCIGALDVCPLVWTSEADHEAARDTAFAVAEMVAEVEVPVFLYGDLATAEERQERAYFRSGGLSALRARMGRGDLLPDFGPRLPHPSAGAVLITARPPLAAFNVLLEGGGMEAARNVAAGLRESGGGLPGVRAIAVDLGDGGAQVSTNVHDPVAVPLAAVVERIAELAAQTGARPGAAEIVGLVPEASLAGFPAEIVTPGFDPDLHVLERRL